jgi:hypothetical protein
MNKNYKKKYIECSCCAEGLHLMQFDDEEYVYLSVWQTGYCKNNKLSWKNKLRYIWQVIKTGSPFHDQLVLDKEACKEIIDFLSSE